MAGSAGLRVRSACSRYSSTTAQMLFAPPPIPSGRNGFVRSGRSVAGTAQFFESRLPHRRFHLVATLENVQPNRKSKTHPP